MNDEITGPGLQQKSRLDRALGEIPGFLASHWHVAWLMGLGVYLIVLPLFGVQVSQRDELLGGNYTNVASAIGGCIAAGGTVNLVRHNRKTRKLTEVNHKIVADLYHQVTGEHHPESQVADGTGNQQADSASRDG